MALNEAVTTAGIDPARYSFVDYGSGKGRVVMIAAARGFQRAIGVEFAPELHDIALANGRRFTSAGGSSTRCEFILGDAGSYDPPAGPDLRLHLQQLRHCDPTRSVEPLGDVRRAG
ncbi:class I SAM-dependent methyltransferase [Sphingomonas sp.]|uniref:class I SAM-dependent methyltransferase n=1 Tax=Sphingomonas sp. TaxID=28214 RepID=UPI002635AA27|nr:class I SAM-dependent methyltransferase [Sphingomonas sp.]